MTPVNTRCLSGQLQGTRRSGRLISTLFICAALLGWQPATAADCAVKPATHMQPDAVIKAVIAALRDNTSADEGIQQVYCLAAPSNKQITGPIDRFTRMIKRGYGEMLNHVASEFEPIKVSNGIAQQRVWLETADGRVVGYLFRLSRQAGGEFDNMWMTEAVYRLDPADRQRSI